MTNCSQCDKPSIGAYGASPLCLDCLERVSNIVHQQNEQRHREMLHHMQLANAADENLNELLGFGGSKPMFDLSTHQGSRNVKINSFNVSNSVVGAISTEEVGNISVSLRNATARGEGVAAEKLHEFTNQIIASSELDVGTKNELLEQISLLSEQIATPKETRKVGLIKAAMTAIGSTAATVSSVASAWSAVKDLLTS